MDKCHCPKFSPRDSKGNECPREHATGWVLIEKPVHRGCGPKSERKKRVRK